jgi:hypothetical protein
MTDTKQPDDDNPDELRIVFAPGCFDAFDGTPDELAEIMAAIRQKFAGLKPGEVPPDAQPMTDEDFEEMAQALAEAQRIPRQ